MEILKILFLYFFIRHTKSEYEPANLKICSKEFKQTIESNQCNKGIWLHQPIEPGCICVRGVWALTNGFCDENAVIIVGDGHCYHIPFEVRSAKLIGDPKDPFKPKVYVAPMTLDAFYEIREGNFTPTILSDPTLIIGINPRQVAQRKDYGLCVDLEPKDYGKPAHIYLNPRRMSKEFILDHKKEYTCPATTQYQHHIAFGEMFVIGKNKIEPRKLVERHCKQDCPGELITSPRRPDRPKPPIAIQGRTMGGGGSGGGDEDGGVDLAARLKKAKSEKVSTAHDELQRTRVRGPIKTMEERQQEKEEMRANATQDVDYYEKEVNEQTLRMMHAHISPLLLNIPGPQVVTREYIYFQHIRLVVEKACPEEYVPKSILKGLMRMFRQLLWETQDTFQHIQGGNDQQFNRTLSRLAECAEKTLSPSVLFATYNESWSAKDNMTAPKPERCPVPLIYAINGTAYNRTWYKKDEPQFIRNFTYFFPPHLKYNSSQVDFVIESAWKITMIGHYRCSKYFDDETAIDFSHFFHQIQSFFNHRIIKRWYYEKSVQATMDIVRMIFPSYDLKKFMFGLDSCLAGTQGFSQFDYSNIWIQRPKIPHTENDLSQKKFALPGSTSLLSTNDYAPPPPPRTTKSPQQQQQPQAANRRGKREIKGYHLWNDRARCINDYMDPVMKQEYGYHLPAECVTPIDPFQIDM